MRASGNGFIIFELPPSDKVGIRAIASLSLDPYHVFVDQLNRKSSINPVILENDLWRYPDSNARLDSDSREPQKFYRKLKQFLFIY
ncbi:hypothetical protein TNCT_171911 [Trichonephila clavata]|uniref:Uncharacterized protein n=1 Tax=Trichonephila clavata TaxID=2740835 RepID=A0A8X6F0E1_TRICU|nr:hypothetical protein TNCT_171911 [Trichonephila clavata]